MGCKKENGCPFWDDEICGGDSGRCPCDELMSGNVENEVTDPLDKNATDISVYDVYSESELM